MDRYLSILEELHNLIYYVKCADGDIPQVWLVSISSLRLSRSSDNTLRPLNEVP